MKKNPLISIITVCYNSDKTISKTLESVLNQTYKNIEYIIIDGKSDDNTIKIIKKYEKKFKGRLRYISEKDNGIYDAMNKGIRMAKGDFIGIINSDDYYELDAVSNIVNNITGSKYQVLYGFLRVLKDNKEKIIYMTSHENIEYEMIPHPTCFISRDIYSDFGYYNTEYKSCSDYDFMLRIRNEKIDYTKVYNIIANFTLGGISENNKSRIETINMKRKYGIIKRIDAFKQILKLRIKIIFNK